MPVITASGEEAVVTAWFVDEGDPCTGGQMIAEVQAEKVSAEVEASGAGYIVDRVALGVPVPQGSAICRIVETVEAPADVSAAVSIPRGQGGPTTRLAASPAAKRVAKELGVDLGTITGSGPAGRITESDVRDALGTAPGPSHLREVIARNMRRSQAETAAVTLHSAVVLGEVTPKDFTARIVKAVAETLPDHRDLNGYREGGVFVAAEVAQVAVAIQTDEGLLAPVVKSPASKSIETIAQEIRDLADRAAAKTLNGEDFEGATFTLSNLGKFGIDGFTPIINYPQVAILGVGAVRRVPIVDADGLLTTANQVILSLTFDHALVDGAPAAMFLEQVGRAIAVT